MPAPAMNPWDQLTPEQQAALARNLQAALPNAGGAGGAGPAQTPLQQRMGGAPMPPGWPGAGQPLSQMPQNPNLGWMGGPPARQAPVQDFPEQAGPPAAAAPAQTPPQAPPPAAGGLPLYLPKETVQQQRAAAAAKPLQVPYAPGHGPWDLGETSPGQGKSPRDYQGQKDAGNPNGGQPPDKGNADNQGAYGAGGAGNGGASLADTFGLPGMGMFPNPRSMFKPASMAPRGTSPANPLQAAGSPQSQLPGGAPSLLQLTQDPAKIALGQQQALTTAMPELHNDNHLAPIDPMTMVGRKSEGEANQKQDIQQQLTQVISDPAYAQALQRLTAGTPGLNAMRQDTGQLADVTRERLGHEKNLGAMGGLDLSPLMALSDTWFGGDLSKGYHSPLERLAKTAEISKTLTGAEGALSGHELDFLKTQLQDKLMSDFASSLGGKREVQVGMGGGGAGMMNPMEMMRFIAEQAERAHSHEHQASADAGKFADENGAQYATIQNALRGIDQIAQKNHGYRDNYLPGYGGKTPLVGGLIQNFHNPTSLGQSEEGKDLQRHASTLITAADKIDFGSKITNFEMAQQGRNLALAQGQGPRQFLKALKDFQDAFKKALGSRYGSMTPEAQEKAKKAGSLMPDDFSFGFGMDDQAPPKPAAKAPLAAPAARAGASAPPAGRTSDIIPEASKDVDQIDALRRQAKERARALGGK